jgi:hypothetical protein
MNAVKLGISGLEVSAIAFGTWQLNGEWRHLDEHGAISAIREGAEHIYAAEIGHRMDHLHLRLIARYPGTALECWRARVDERPDALRGGADPIAADPRPSPGLRNVVQAVTRDFCLRPVGTEETSSCQVSWDCWFVAPLRW